MVTKPLMYDKSNEFHQLSRDEQFTLFLLRTGHSEMIHEINIRLQISKISNATVEKAVKTTEHIFIKAYFISFRLYKLSE